MHRRDFIKGAAVVLVTGAGFSAINENEYKYPKIVEIADKYTKELVLEENNAVSRKWWYDKVYADVKKELGDSKEFLVICDETNNSPEMINANGFRGEVIVGDINTQVVKIVSKAGALHLN